MREITEKYFAMTKTNEVQLKHKPYVGESKCWDDYMTIVKKNINNKIKKITSGVVLMGDTLIFVRPIKYCEEVFINYKYLDE